MDPAVKCPYCAEGVSGISAEDLLNNLRWHFADDCPKIDPEDAARV